MEYLNFHVFPKTIFKSYAHMKHIFLITCLFLTCVASAQTDKKEKPTFQYVDKQPQPGYDIEKYLKQNTLYPDAMREINLQGTAVVRFVVDTDGHISDATILKGIGGGGDEEALRVVTKMPNWKPAERDGKKVKVYHSLPVVFKLDTDGSAE